MGTIIEDTPQIRDAHEAIEGIAIIEPNVRGSSGYGQAYRNLDNGRQREDAVRDVGALLDWIASQDDPTSAAPPSWVSPTAAI